MRIEPAIYSFRRRVPTTARLTLQYLTFDDIALYVRQNLTQQPSFCDFTYGHQKQATRLIHMITSKASGIFLWVVLAVQSLAKGLMDGDRVRDLEGQLNEIPSQSEDLFKKVLYGLKGRYFTDAARLFRIYKASQTQGIGFDRGLPLLALDFADEAKLEWTAQQLAMSLTAKEWYRRPTSMKHRLNSRCRGLIEIVPRKKKRGIPWNVKEVNQLVPRANSSETQALKKSSAYGRDLARTTVQYLHRTAKGYLESPGVWEIIENAAATEGVVSPIISLHVANIRL